MTANLKRAGRLNVKLPGLLENVDLATRQRMWLQQDGAPPHFLLIVREFLKLNFNERWIGGEGPFEWPPCSPDLTARDFFLWGYIKYVVFAQRLTTKEDLMKRIRRACAAISRETLLKTVDGFERRLYVCVFKPMESTSNSYSVADCNTGSNGEKQGDSR